VQRHSEMRDAGKEITKLLSSSNRTVKTTKGSPSWKACITALDKALRRTACGVVGLDAFMLDWLP
jgi:hypothetical protein